MDLTPQRNVTQIRIDEVVIEGGAGDADVGARVRAAVLGALRQRGVTQRVAGQVGEHVGREVSRSVKP
jgi:hypothetical protein